MHFGNFICLYYNFLTDSLKFIKGYIISKGISQGTGDIDFTKITIFEKITKKKEKKTLFLALFRNRLEKN